MALRNLAGAPVFAAPEGFGVRSWRPGDEEVWLSIHREADRFNTFGPDTFEKQFGGDAERLAVRQLYLCDAAGAAIGTSTAWFGDETRPGWGRVHWVALRPGFQGRGLSKPLLFATLKRLAQLGHDKAYLTTDTQRRAAIGLYLAFGFEPEVRNEEERSAWGAMGVCAGGAA